MTGVHCASSGREDLGRRPIRPRESSDWQVRVHDGHELLGDLGVTTVVDANLRHTCSSKPRTPERGCGLRQMRA
jgi:hypothetical protein